MRQAIAKPQNGISMLGQKCISLEQAGVAMIPLKV
jgi:hypothetical protein